MSEQEAAEFLESLTLPGMISMGKVAFPSPELYKRAPVLSEDTEVRPAQPVSGYQKLIEYWNIHKKDTLGRAREILGGDGRELYEREKELLSWMCRESGVNFIREGRRFGNVEVYFPPVYQDGFRIKIHKEDGLKRTTVRKVIPVMEDLIVNCTAECRGRCILNQTRLFPSKAGTDILEFWAEEPMSHVEIRIWDQSSGELVFSEKSTLMMRVVVGVNIGSTTYHIQDPWSEKLLKAASNRRNVIKKKIETVMRTSSDRPIDIKSKTHTFLDDAMEEGRQLFAGYSLKPAKGAFIPVKEKDGEIESFLKIREYIDEDSVREVLLADPYFSVQAAVKVLPRIRHMDVSLTILTSLGDKDPDTDDDRNSNGCKDSDTKQKTDIVEEYKEILRKNAAIMPGKLRIYNLRRGKSQVFHDRYLIRTRKDGTIEGFLLSNSLNSMGQFYPFVITPMEREVCLDVWEYLNSLADPEIQKGVPAKQRISRETLFDSSVRLAASGSDRKPEEDQPQMPDISQEQWKIWCSGEHPGDMLDAIRGTEGGEELFLAGFIPAAREEETRQKREHRGRGLEDPEYMIWALLQGRAKPDRQGFSRLFESAGHIWYSQGRWLAGGYRILLSLCPEAYLDLMKETSSPLMFDQLAKRMLFDNWSDDLYRMVAGADALCLRLLGAEWLDREVRLGKISTEQVTSVWERLTGEKRLFQAVRLLSRLTFSFRTHPSTKKEIPEGESICKWLEETIARELPGCPEDCRKEALDWLHDCKAVSRVELHLRVAERITEPSVRGEVLDSAIEIAKRELFKISFRADWSELIELYLRGMEERYGSQAETQILKTVMSWEAFETAAEPGLKDYDYHKWSRASLRAEWQMKILRSFCQNHPESIEMKKWLEEWQGVLAAAGL
ncbi:MAG: hypothetical protein LIO92_00790 [Clostridiales bacterium]|nr:hypothetical protein [Clostridiales bacterium]